MEAFPKIRDAVKTAFGKVRPEGLKDKDLMAYTQLQPHDFATLVEKHGEEKVIQYVKDMEARRRSNGN